MKAGYLWSLFFSYSTISNHYLIKPIVSTVANIGGIHGAEHINGSILRTIGWNIPASHNFEEFWPSSGFMNNQFLLIIGNNGYLYSKMSSLVPTPDGVGVWVPRGQRPALNH